MTAAPHLEFNMNFIGPRDGWIDDTPEPKTAKLLDEMAKPVSNLLRHQN
jgi:hypothetical protein